jgi:hypothetical protein
MSARAATIPAVTPPVATVPPGRAALSGAIAAGLALGLAELLAGLLPGATSLVSAVGQAIIDRQPAGAKDLVVALFGTNDKLALELVVTLAAIGIGALLGIVAVRRYAVAAIGFAAFGVVGFLAALGIPSAMPAMVAAQTAIAVALGLQALVWLLDAARTVPTAATTLPTSTASVPPTDPARRSFLLRSAILGIGALGAGLVGRSLVEGARAAPTGTSDLIPPARTSSRRCRRGRTSRLRRPGSRPSSCPTTRSTGSTRRCSCRASTSRAGRCGSTASWIGRRR